MKKRRLKKNGSCEPSCACCAAWKLHDELCEVE